MCGLVGFINFKKDISSYKNVLVDMNSTLSKKVPDEDGYYIKNNIALSYKKLIELNPNFRKSTYDRKFLL